MIVQREWRPRSFATHAYMHTYKRGQRLHGTICFSLLSKTRRILTRQKTAISRAACQLWLTGIRWFHYDEYLRYNSEQLGQGTNRESDELWLEIKTKNDLVGWQVGGQLTYALSKSFVLMGSSRFGVYNNHITAWQGVHSGDGTYAVFNSGAAAGNAYNITATRNALAFLGEIDLGVRWQITNCIAARAGYRAMGISGVATTDDQISRDFSCPCHANHINLSSIALHGMYVGGEVCW